MTYLILILALITIALIFLLYFRKNHRLSKAQVKEKHTTPYSFFMDWNGKELHYTDEGEGFPILMVHGFGGSYKNFEDLGNLLVDKYRIIKVDLPGFGLSDFPEFKEKEPDYDQMYLDYFNHFTTTLQLDSFHLMGCSMGGLFSWRATVNQPHKVQKLVLFNSAGYDLEKIANGVTKFMRYKFIRKFLVRGIPRSLTEKGLKRVFYNPSKLSIDKIQAANDFWNKNGNLEALLDLASAPKYVDIQLIQTIQNPTLVVWGKNDGLISVKHADYFSNDIKNSEQIIYDKCGHAPMIEIPQLIKNDIIAFLEK